MEWNTLRKEIETILTAYMAAQSNTGTAMETRAQDYLTSWFTEQAYFQGHPEFWGKHPLPADALNRHVVWGMVRGKGPDTVVLVHHYDVVETRDFGAVQPFACNLGQVKEKLKASGMALSPAAQKDLEDPDWLFGRGGADMKGGGAIQLALLNAFSREEDLPGNLVICCLPDEENLSAGMRAALTLLDELKSRYGLNYRLMIDSEPHEREDAETGIIYEGSVGKIMPFVYARGVLAHSGRIFEGVSPIHLMSELIIRTDLNMDLSEKVGDQTLPPPCWLYAKDGKQTYDVSLPTHACAYMNALTLNVAPATFLDNLMQIAKEAFGAVIERMNENYKKFTGEDDAAPLPWQPCVRSFSQLFDAVAEENGDTFQTEFHGMLARLKETIDQGKITLMDASFAMVEFCLSRSRDTRPLMVIGISPPYYPHVCNDRVDNLSPEIAALVPEINAYTRKAFGQSYVANKYFTGISDLSYTYPPGNLEDLESVTRNMPLWGKTYSIPFDSVERIKMPCCNIGPWGKDLHKVSERVNATDLYERTPKIINRVIRQLLGMTPV